jgi:hypothetical protein
MVRTKENADGGETTRTGHPSCPPVRNLVSYWYDSAPWRTWRRFNVGVRTQNAELRTRRGHPQIPQIAQIHGFGQSRSAIAEWINRRFRRCFGPGLVLGLVRWRRPEAERLSTDSTDYADDIYRWYTVHGVTEYGPVSADDLQKATGRLEWLRACRQPILRNRHRLLLGGPSSPAFPCEVCRRRGHD